MPETYLHRARKATYPRLANGQWRDGRDDLHYSNAYQGLYDRQKLFLRAKNYNFIRNRSMNPTVLQLATKANQADHEYEMAFRHFFNEASYVPYMDDANFWLLIEELRDCLSKHLGSSVSDSLFQKDYELGMKNFVWAYFFRKRTAEDKPYNSMDLTKMFASFMRTYKRIYDRYYEALFNLPGLERSDDGYGDLIDQLPLLGPKFYDDVMNGGIEDYYDFCSKVLNIAGTGLCKMILHGENYVRQNIYDSVRDCLKAACHGEG